MPTVLVYRRLKRNACRETDNYNRSGNRALFLSAHSYTFVSSILFFLSPSLFLSVYLILYLYLYLVRSILLFYSFFNANCRDKLAGVLLAHSFTVHIHLLFTSRISPPFYYATLHLGRLWISSITSRYSLHPSCSHLFLPCLQTWHYSSFNNRLSNPNIKNFSDVKMSLTEMGNTSYKL